MLNDAELLPLLLKKLSFDNLEDMYAAIGYGGLTATKAFGRIRDDLVKATRQQAPQKEQLPKTQTEQNQKSNRHKASGVIVEGIESCMIKFSKCCTPVPGDDIIGFVTRGYGVSVHRKDCINAQHDQSSRSQRDRWVPVAWATNDNNPFSTTLEIDSMDRGGLFLDVASVLNAAKVKVTEMAGREMPAGKARIVATFEVKNVEELEGIRNRLRQISGVMDVRRGQG